MSCPYPVAVIGVGCASPGGFGEPPGAGRTGLAAQLAAGASWFATSTVLSHPDVVGAAVPAIPADRDVGDPRVHRLMARGARLAAIAVRAAWHDAALSAAAREEAGFFYGVGASGGARHEIDAVLRAAVDDEGRYSERRMGERGLKVFHPLRTFTLLPNFTLCHSAILDGIRGPSGAMFSRGAGTVTALIEAAHAIADGDCPVAIAGGADSALDCLTWAELARDGHAAAGLVPGEAGAAVVLVSVDDPRPARAWITGAAIAPIGDNVDAAIGDILARLGGHDLAVLAAWGATADAARRCLGDRVLDLCASAGDALAASPAVAWCAAIDAIANCSARSVVVVSAGPDGHVAAVRFIAPESALPAQHAGGPAQQLARRSHRIPGTAPRRAVITGVGVVSAFGVGLPALFDGLTAGRRAIRPITCFDASPLAARIGGQVPDDVIDAAWLRAHLPVSHHGTALRWLATGALRDRKIGFALVAAAEAMRHSRLDLDERERRRVPLALACGLERALLEDLVPVLTARGVDWAAEARRATPAIRNRVAVDMAARAVAELLGLGPITVHASACAAGAIAVSHGAALIERGADVVICGAADSMLDPISYGAMIALGTTSPRRDDLDACRPFDRKRDGLVLGEGAAVFVLESAAHAHARGARPLATVLGWGGSQDGFRPSAPDPEGVRAAVAMARALARANVTPDQLGYVNAHGTGTPLNDVAETRALRRALGPFADDVAVSSIKGAVGHLMTAAGAIELAASLLAFERDLLPGTAGHSSRDPECDLDIIGEAPRSARVDVLLSNSFGFGGQNAAVVLGRPA